jgi:methanogenesis imperfect marker protein 11
MVQILRPDEVKQKYGPLFCKGFLTMVDEERGVGQIVEKCSSRGPGEWDVVNRKRSGGVIEDIRMEGQTLIMDVKIGEKELTFGPVSDHVGGQGLAAFKVEGDRIRTTWYGIAGATVGIGACLPQCPDVIQTEYPDDFKIGGAHVAHVDIITPKTVRIIVGIDDTDTKEKGASWVTALKMGSNCPFGSFIDHKIIQLNPKVPDKTTNCCSTAVSFAVKEENIPSLIEYCRDFVKKESYSSGSVMTVFKGLSIPPSLYEYGIRAKTEIITEDDAVKAARENGVQIISITGTKGAIGAVAAIGCFDMGGMAAGIPEDFR